MLGVRLIKNILFLLVLVLKDIDLCASDLTEINEFLDEYNKQGDELQYNETLAAWNYEVTMTAESREQMLKWSEKTARFAVEKRKTAKRLLREIGDEVVPRKLLRQLKLITRTAASRSDVINNEISSLQSKMTSIYSKTVIEKTIGNESYRFRLKEQLLPIMTDVRKENLKNLKWAFRVWREAVGRKIKPLYERFVPIVNVGAQENGYDDYGDFWRAEYQERHLEQNIEYVLEDMADLYRKIHAYIRFRLNKMLGDDVVGQNGMIPIHLLNMWGQNWSHLYKMFVPYPSKTIPDVTKEMKNKGWDNTDMLKLAESFFVSLGLENMPKSFYRNSVITQPSDTKPACFPSSWDLGHGDVRLKMPCMAVTHNDLMTVHHEMGHIQYYLMYQHQPLEYRTGANPGFHEAVGDTIALSVMTPQHLESIGLLQDTVGDEEEDMNFLFKQALQKIPFIRFAYIVDKWRWSVFQGTTKPEEYNKYWWQLRKKYQGVRTPKGMVRADEELCDPATFFHVAHNTEYLRYFLSHILQFQFHQALCNEAGIGRPYHRCSIYKSKKAGLKLRSMMELGKEYPWNEALEVLTGSNRLSAKPLLNYFKPLEDWLDDHRKENDYQIGWEQEELDL